MFFPRGGSAHVARALARRPRVVLLDDALSAVDTHTEAEILRGLQGALSGRTAVIASHRVSTVRDAALEELDPATLYRILALRTDVFVVEQDCPYPELDGRDVEPERAHQCPFRNWHEVGALPMVPGTGWERR